MVEDDLEEGFETKYFQNLRDERTDAYRERSIQLLKGLEGGNANWLLSMIHQRLERQGEALGTNAFVDDGLRHLVETSLQPTVLISKNRRILFLSQAAGEILGRQSTLKIDGNRLVGAGPEDERFVKRMLAGMVKHEHKADGHKLGKAFTLAAIDGRPAYFAAVEAIQIVHNNSTMLAMFLFDPQASPRINIDRLRSWYGLSKREAQLAATFACGTTLKEYAENQSVSITTVRTQFAQIKAKMNASDQAGVVRLALLAQTKF